MRLRTLLSVVVLASACRAPSDGGPTDATATLTHTGDTGTPWEGFQPLYFGVVDVVFAVDAAGDATSWTDPTAFAPVPIRVEIALADAQGASLEPEHACRVSFVHDGPLSPATFGAGLSAWSVYEIPSDATVFSDCDRFDFPPGWEDGPEQVLSRWTWGFGVGPVDAAVEQDLRDQLGTGFDALEPYVAGGGFYWDGLVTIPDLPVQDWQDGWVDTGVTFAYEVDPSLTRVLYGGYPVLVEAAELSTGTGLASAEYELQGTTLLQPASLLLTE